PCGLDEDRAGTSYAEIPCGTEHYGAEQTVWDHRQMITQVDRAVQVLRERMTNAIDIRSQVPLAPYSTLRVGGRAEWLVEIRDLDTLAQAAMICQEIGAPHQVIGSGSNLLVSDKGAPGITIVNLCSKIRFAELLFAETGVWFQDLFLFAAQRGLAGLEFAVGIPGT